MLIPMYKLMAYINLDVWEKLLNFANNSLAQLATLSFECHG